MDGLSTLVPSGDPDYLRQRGPLAIEEGTTPLDADFSLPPALAGLAPLWASGELLPVHAAHSGYGARSHFEGQDCLENGTTDPRGADDGWLYRALAAADAPGAALAFDRNLPLVLRGARPIASVNPLGEEVDASSLVQATQRLWGADPVLGPALEEGIAARARVAGAGGRRIRKGDLRAVAEGASRALVSASGVRVATLEVNGWDTHARQGAGTGQLASRLTALADGLLVLREGLGSAWDTTVVVAATEFGRTVRPNGTGGTDHGSAGAALVLGGAVRGGRVLADWPGLSDRDLHEGRDLRATTDLRAVFAGVLSDHLGLPDRAVAAAFPGLGEPLTGIVRG